MIHKLKQIFKFKRRGGGGVCGTWAIAQIIYTKINRIKIHVSLLKMIKRHRGQLLR